MGEARADALPSGAWKSRRQGRLGACLSRLPYSIPNQIQQLKEATPMSVFTRRTRTVSFRLSEEEYKELRDTCIAHGVRSMSDFARLSTQWWIDGDGGPNESLLATIRELRGKLRELDSEVKRLAAEERTTLTAMLEQALRELLARRRERRERARVALPTFKGQGLQPGVDLDDTSALLDLMEGHDAPV